jgi:hypothetical protein
MLCVQGELVGNARCLARVRAAPHVAHRSRGLQRRVGVLGTLHSLLQPLGRRCRHRCGGGSLRARPHACLSLIDFLMLIDGAAARARK